MRYIALILAIVATTLPGAEGDDPTIPNTIAREIASFDKDVGEAWKDFEKAVEAAREEAIERIQKKQKRLSKTDDILATATALKELEDVSVFATAERYVLTSQTLSESQSQIAHLAGEYYHSKESQWRMVFHEDKTVTTNFTNRGTQKGSYTLLEDGNILLTFPEAPHDKPLNGVVHVDYAEHKLKFTVCGTEYTKAELSQK